MTPTEFKSWFEGFTEAMSGTPTKAQWARIKERVSQIDGKPTTERVFIDRYYTPYVHYWPCIGSGVGVGSISNVVNTVGFDAAAAMYSLGCVDAVTSGGTLSAQ